MLEMKGCKVTELAIDSLNKTLHCVSLNGEYVLLEDYLSPFVGFNAALWKICSC